jgi:hypothetical protein
MPAAHQTQADGVASAGSGAWSRIKLARSAYSWQPAATNSLDRRRWVRAAPRPALRGGPLGREKRKTAAPNWGTTRRHAMPTSQ